MKKYNVAILGATGAVGQEFLKLIEVVDKPGENDFYYFFIFERPANCYSLQSILKFLV